MLDFGHVGDSGGAGLEILLIAGDDADARLIERALRENPRVCGVVRATDGAHALELIGDGLEPDLALIGLDVLAEGGFGPLVQLSSGAFPIVVLGDRAVM